MNDCVVLPVGSKFLALALIIPAVTVDVKLKGFPIANTHSPILVASLSPNIAYGSSFSVSTFNNAISFCSSLPISLASNSLLSFVVIRIFSALSIT